MVAAGLAAFVEGFLHLRSFDMFDLVLESKAAVDWVPIAQGRM